MKRIFCTLWLIAALSGLPPVLAQDFPNRYANNRELRYIPDSSDFVFRGSRPRLFNRALYGSNQAFRLETGDLPEFGFYTAAGMSGNVQFALVCGEKAIWLKDVQNIECRYRPGKRIYQIRDSLLAGGEITLTAIARYDKEGAIFQFKTQNTPAELKLITLYGGARGKKFSRNGDLGVDPEDAFCLKTDYCHYNRYDLSAQTFQVWYGINEDLSQYTRDELMLPEKKIKSLYGCFPGNCVLSIGDALQIQTVQSMLSAAPNTEYPVLRSVGKLPAGEVVYIGFSTDISDRLSDDFESLFKVSCDSAEHIAAHLKIDTPDPFINAAGGAIAMAADGIWESPSYYHGAIGWRSRLAGWRGAYTGDVLGWHEHAREHFRAYAASQMTDPADKAVIMDTALNIARSAKIKGTPMYSNGYIARYPNSHATMNHYDMNLCYIDELLWHLRWTGDLEFAEEVWPVLERHLAWEKRCFDADDDGLYDAYCCIWASDALQYEGGGVTHSSAYNYRANLIAAEIAVLIGKNPTPYQKEAEKILKAVNEQLWLPEAGHWAEFKDALGKQLVHPSAGLWTVYHAIDSRIHDHFKAYQALRYIDTEIPHLPVNINGTGDFYMEPDLAVVSTTNWLPYYWSINNVAFAEIMHTALAYFQGGRYEEAYTLMKSALMDGMYLGGSPGNVGQISFYDAARGESYRDFADPVGVYARTMVQGLFGVIPDLMHQIVFLRPAFPASWDTVSFEIPDIRYSYRRSSEGVQHWRIVPHFQKEVDLVFEIPVRHDRILAATVNGKAAKGQFDDNAVGQPILRIFCGKETNYEIEIRESNRPLPLLKYPAVAVIGEDMEITMPEGIEMIQIFDPQGLLKDVQFSAASLSFQPQGTEGFHTFFVETENEAFSWWQAVDLEIRPMLEIIAEQTDSSALAFSIRNNSPQKNITAELWLNHRKILSDLSFPANSLSDPFYIELPEAVHGSNFIQLRQGKQILQENTVCQWSIPFDSTARQQPIAISTHFNDRINRIFEYGKYMSPRSPYTTLQLPSQGYGDWCGPNTLPKIDDSGLRNMAGRNGLFKTPYGLIFSTPSATDANNVAFVSQWDNYPDDIHIAVQGKASHAYLLMAASTNHMQCNMTNALIVAEYSDHTSDTLRLTTPEKLAPIEQDYYTDGKAFRINADRPYRVQLSTGLTDRNLKEKIASENTGEYINHPANRMIPGGAAIILDMPLNPRKKLKNIHLYSITNENVTGLVSLTLIL